MTVKTIDEFTRDHGHPDGAPAAHGEIGPRDKSAGGCTRRTTVGQLYEENFEFVWRSLRRLGVGYPQLDDATHDVFIVVHRKLGEFAGKSSIRTWMFGIALRIARNYRGRSPRILASASSVDESADPSGSPLEARESRERVALLYRLLDKLDDEKREVFVLAELEELSAPQIAETLNIKLNTVYSRLRSARLEFQLALSREGDGNRRGEK